MIEMFTAPTSRDLSSQPRDRVAFWFAVVVTVVIFGVGLSYPIFCPDSWAFLELSNNVFTDFYSYNTLRQFENPIPYSNSFPPLWPVLLAVVRRVIDLGIYTGYLLNFGICVGLLVALVSLFKRAGFEALAGVFCYLFILGFPGFIGEALAGRTIPLSLLLLTLAVLPLANRAGVTMTNLGLAGLFMGLNCLTRFDALFQAGLLGIAFTVRRSILPGHWSRAPVSLLTYTFAVMLPLTPWFGYGMSHFGKPVPSDNTRQVLSSVPRHVIDYYEEAPPSDLTQHPWDWIDGLVRQKASLVLWAGLEAVVRSAVVVLLPSVLVAWIWSGRPRFSRQAVGAGLIGAGLILVMIFPSMLAGYGRIRYFTGPVLVMIVMLLATLVSLIPNAWSERRIATLLVTVAGLIGVVVPLSLYYQGLDVRDSGIDLAPRSPTPAMNKLTEIVRDDTGGGPHRILFTHNTTAARYGAVTGEPSSLMPRFVGGNLASFVRDWEITHLYDPDNSIAGIDASGVELVPLDVPGLYRMRQNPSWQFELGSTKRKLSR